MPPREEKVRALMGAVCVVRVCRRWVGREGLDIAARVEAVEFHEVEGSCGR